MKSRRPLPPPSPTVAFVLLTTLLVLIGTFFVFEASGPESYTTYGNQFRVILQHLIGLGIGIVAALVGVSIPLHWHIKFAPVLFGVAILLLILTLIPGIGVELNGARRWLSLGGTTVQPAEFAKFATIAFLASWLHLHQRLAPFIATLTIPALLIILQPDLGSLLAFSGITFSLFLFAGGSLKKLASLGGVAIPLLMVLILVAPYRMRRITTFFNPESDPQGASFHIRQVTLALGRGGLFGQGLGNSTQKYNYIPEASTDSIFAVIAEETGYIGSLILISLYGLMILAAYRAIEKSQGADRLLGLGIIAWLSVQAMLNLAAMVALVPLTGIPLPFFSYGRTSLIMLLFAVGILVRISLEYESTSHRRASNARVSHH